MSSGACRALVAVMLALMASAALTLPAAAATEQLNERSTVTYTVDPENGVIDVRIIINLRNQGDRAVEAGEWGPIYIEDVAQPRFTPRSTERTEFTQLPGLWKSMNILAPRVASGERQRVIIEYTLEAPIARGSALSRTPARVGDGYVYFCVPGQDTDSGSISVELPSRFRTTQSGTIMEETDRGLQANLSSDPVDLFTCIEATHQRRLAEDTFVGPGGREIVLQAWPESAEWLVPARTNVEPALDAIERFIGFPMPGDGPVTIRQTPPRSLGGYASAHDTPGVVQMDELAGVDIDNRNHEMAHAWFGTNQFPEQWMREGMATWVSTSMADATCDPVTAEEADLDLSDWQVVRPTSSGDIDEIVAAQDAAVCGIVAAVVERMGRDAWTDVMGSLLNGELKYIGTGDIGAASTTTVDYREWLDAVDERGLVPSGDTDLDFAQNLLAAYDITPDPLLLQRRSETRAKYHQFLADAAPMGAPAIVREAMDNWFFDAADVALAKSYEVLQALDEADALLPEAGLVPFIQPGFEAARTPEELDAVLSESTVLLESAEGIIPPLGELRDASPESWGLPAAVRNAITQQRFDDVIAAVDPALDVVKAVVAADDALPEAGLVEKYQNRYEATSSAESLSELASTVIEEGALAESAGFAYTALRNEVGDWLIPSAVTAPIETARISDALVILEDARGVVSAARAADMALPEAEISADIRPQFEAVTTAEQMADLRERAEKSRDDARTVGSALSSLRARVPGWTIPEVVTKPVSDRDFALAAETAAAAQRWVEWAWQADQNLPQIDAINRTRPEFEGAMTLAELRTGGKLAEDWATASQRVSNAVEVFNRDRDLLADLGLWGTDVQPVLDDAIAAAVDGNVALATSKSAEVIETINGGSGAGGLRLAGLVFFGVAVLGVLGLWLVFRRQAGPSWARDTKPHWLEDGSRFGRGRRKDG